MLIRKLQPQFKPLNQGLQSLTKTGLQTVLGWWITMCGYSRLESVAGLQNELAQLPCSIAYFPNEKEPLTVNSLLVRQYRY